MKRQLSPFLAHFSGALNLDFIYEIESLELLKNSLKKDILPGSEYILTQDESDLVINSLEPQRDLRYRGGGGSSANTCVILSSLGIRSSFIGACGVDEAGDIVLSSMEGVDLSTVKRLGNTAICIILVPQKERDRTILVCPGTDHFPTPEQKEIRFLHLSSLPTQRGLEFHKALVSSLHKDAVLSLDPGEIYSAMGIDAISPILRRTDLLFITESELGMLIGENDPQKLLSYLRSVDDTFGPFHPSVIVKRGPKGAVCYTKTAVYEAEAKKVEAIVDNTGAGDAFNAGFLYSWLNHKAPFECLFFANNVAALSLSDWGRNWIRRLKHV
ncbi:Ribokinase [Dissulfuribacter thermophilus]|uniref:Ribokinase n=1 Tax=Dissulfuribacter thermophilus TaxID=1156395 RepID=A0A1B9F621_9BACT|nr:carbohydrate kinase family protein [Dissulfuribacter thermophilus]OCC15284.1 Ribokinase [Dissulfuribacter thermophilus]